jgi:DNA-binding SARP family transcriptional activator
MLRLTLLGRPQITLNDNLITDFVSDKALVLLCYLAVQGQPFSRESLAALLWGEMPDDRAKANLRMALYNLQKLVPGYL